MQDKLDRRALLKTGVLLAAARSVPAFGTPAVSVPIRVDARAVVGPLRHIWSQCVGSDRAAMTLRESWRRDLERWHDEVGIRQVRFATLASLSASSDSGIRDFSGVATYTRTLVLPHRVRRGAPLLLDFGTAADMAEVRINDVLVVTLWQAPYAIDIARAVRAGSNRIEVRVVNLWVTRLIGDMQPGARRVAYTSIPTYKPNAPLGPAGLIDRPGRARGSGIMRSNPAFDSSMLHGRRLLAL